jgi:hypothetical protein
VEEIDMGRVKVLLAISIVFWAMIFGLEPAIGQTVTVNANIPADYTITVNSPMSLIMPAAGKYGDWMGSTMIYGTANLPINLYAEDQTGVSKGHLVNGGTTLANLLQCGLGATNSPASATFETLDNAITLTKSPIPVGAFTRYLHFQQIVSVSGDSSHSGTFSKVITVTVAVIYA